MSTVSTSSTWMKAPPDKALWSLVRYPMRAQPFHDRGYHITVPGCWRASQEEWAILKENWDYCPRMLESVSRGVGNTQGELGIAGLVEGIFLAPKAGAEMQSVRATTALEGCGLEGDRYCAGTGHWSRFGRVCEVTFIAAEDLDD